MLRGDEGLILTLIFYAFRAGVLLLSLYLYYNSFMNSGIKGKTFMVFATLISLVSMAGSHDYAALGLLLAFYPLCLYCIAEGWTRRNN